MILAAITTCRRKPEMLERAVKSVVNQTYTDWNLLIVDDSPDGYEFRKDVKEFAESWSRRDSRIKYIQHDRNYGANHARNTALNFAYNTQGGGGYDFIAYLDDDDEWLPEKLKEQAEKFMKCDENTALVCCKSFYVVDDIIGQTYEREFYIKEGYVLSDLLYVNEIGSNSIPLIRLKALHEVGGFDEELGAMQDWDLWLRISAKYKIAVINKPLMKYHVHKSGNITSDIRKIISGAERILSKNQVYYNEYKYAYYRKLSELAILYRQNGQYKKSFETWRKAVAIKPLSIFENLWIIFCAFLPFRFAERAKLKLALKYTGVFKFLRAIKRKIFRQEKLK